MTAPQNAADQPDELEVRPDTPPPQGGGPAESEEDFEADDPDEEASADEAE